MTKYTPEDFANAQFAEHEDGRRAVRTSTPIAPWIMEMRNGPGHFAKDSEMALDGWVPVLTKPTLTDSEVGDIAKDQSDDFLLGFITGFEKAGGTILEETTRERVARLVNDIISERGPAFIGEKVADRLINLGLVKENTK